MIEILRKGGDYSAAVRCDSCRETVDDHRMAMVVFEEVPEGPTRFWICHKGRCDDRLKKTIGAHHPWWELGSFLGRLCVSSGADLNRRNLITDELYTASRAVAVDDLED